MKTPNPMPLYPVYDELRDVDLKQFPQLKQLFDESDPWTSTVWIWGQEFLSYVGRNKSEHTYTRFRTEVEKFLLWAFIIKRTPVENYRKHDILEYIDFCWRPPLHWITLNNHEKFLYEDGVNVVNEHWAPFRLTQAKGDTSKPDKKKYQPSQQTLHATFTAINAFYKHLIDEEYCYGNPVQVAKKDCRYFVKDTQVKEVKRLTEEQWQFMLSVAEQMADTDSQFERNLFLIASLKALFLRISEYAERTDWIPVMGHFWKDQDNNWWLKIYGKGRKLRDVTVPGSFLPYLKRYRLHRGLNALPLTGEKHPIIEKLRGRGGLTSRQLSRLVQMVFDKAFEEMQTKNGEEAAQKFKEASTHWLRHTGASMEVERGRGLKDLSEDLGHASMATTDTVYVQTESKKRAMSGNKRKV
jgi:site-specific recombinase XerD